MSTPSEWQILALGAFAGFTIFLGMPLARARSLSPRVRASLSAIAVGILLFLFVDVLSNAHGIVSAAIETKSTGIASPWILLGSTLLGFAVGVLALQLFIQVFSRRSAVSPAAPGPAAGDLFDPLHLSTVVAVGIGLHNLSEGLAIGTAYAAGLPLAVVLVVGFAVHNSTEGFGILGPGMLAGRTYSWRRLLALGAIGGGPTLVGTVIGSFFTSNVLSVLCYGLAAGAILYVVFEISRPMLAPATRALVVVFVVVGFILGVITDFIVTLGGL